VHFGEGIPLKLPPFWGVEIVDSQLLVKGRDEIRIDQKQWNMGASPI